MPRPAPTDALTSVLYEKTFSRERLPCASGLGADTRVGDEEGWIVCVSVGRAVGLFVGVTLTIPVKEREIMTPVVDS